VKTLKVFYQSRGFNQVKVTPSLSARSNATVITFVIDEGPQDLVDTVQIQGNNQISQMEFAPDGLRLGPGQPYSQKFIDDDRNKVMTYYLDMAI